MGERCPEQLPLMTLYAFVANQRAIGAKGEERGRRGGLIACEAREAAEGGQGRGDQRAKVVSNRFQRRALEGGSVQCSCLSAAPFKMRCSEGAVSSCPP